LQGHGLAAVADVSGAASPGAGSAIRRKGFALSHRVLLIDDSAVVRQLIAAELAADGLEVHCAADGPAGLELARLIRPDVVLLDVHMPGMDGPEVCDLLQIQPETAAVPIIFLSSSAEAADRVRGLNQGAADYIGKPCDGEELRARVRVSLRYRKLLEMESRRAMRDGMTGLWNRAYLDERAGSEVAAAARHGSRLGCVMLDLDHFKAINDRHGHPFGDQAIRAVAAVLERECRREDVPCRYGGEEFLVLCPGVNADGAALLAERLRAAMAGVRLTGLDGRDVAFTCSFGVADLLPGGDVRQLVGDADAALYAAKRAGRNRVRQAARGPVPPAGGPLAA
jgi:two-component system cell cycle response regulator